MLKALPLVLPMSRERLRLRFFLHPTEIGRAELSLATPSAFRDSIDHGLVQVALALRDLGAECEFVSDFSQAGLVHVVHAKQFFRRSAPFPLRELLGSEVGPLVVIRGDFGAWRRLPLHPDYEILPNGFGECPPERVSIPHLPQVGVIRRDESRGNRVAVLGFKGQVSGVPDFLSGDSFRRWLRSNELELRLDLPGKSAEQPSRWHDFSEIDISLVLRNPVQSHRLVANLGDPSGLGKPATRLVNAWVAGTVPIVSPEYPYLEAGRPGEDMLVARNAHEVQAHVERLHNDPYCFQTMRHRVAERAEQFSWSAIATCYLRFFDEVQGAGRRPRARHLGGWRVVAGAALQNASYCMIRGRPKLAAKHLRHLVMT